MTEISARSRLRSVSDLLFEHNGRIGRVWFWIGTAASFVIAGALVGIAEQANVAGSHRNFVLFFILGLVLWINSAVVIKRLHDLGTSALWYPLYGLTPPGAFALGLYLWAEDDVPSASALLAVAVIGTIWVIVELGCIRGTRGPNRFGRDPA